MTKPKLKIKVVNADKNTLEKIKNMSIYPVLEHNFNLDFMLNDNSEPDVIIYSYLGKKPEFLKYNCKRIFMATEHFFPREYFADYKMTNRSAIKSDIFFHSEMPWVQGLEDFLCGDNSEFLISKSFIKKQFCNFIYSNRNCRDRNVFLKSMLNKFGDTVHSWGRYKRNMTALKIGRDIIKNDSNNIDIMKHYKFTIAFENSSRYHSFSEKTMNALMARSIPIYWGGNQIYDFVKKEAFINASDFKNNNELIAYIDKVNNDEKLYNSYILENPFIDSDFIRSQCKESLGQRLKEILNSETPSRAFWQTGLMAKILFYIGTKVFKKGYRLKALKRRFFGGV